MVQHTYAQKFIGLRERYENDARTLKAQRRFPSERMERQTLGRSETLEETARYLSSLTDDTKPKQVLELVEKALNRLAEIKATYIVNYVRWRRRYGINELGEWTAEGAIAQVEEIVPQLCSRLSPQWNLTPRRHDHYYHVYHCLDQATMSDVEVGRRRWCGPERNQWYREVAVLKTPRIDGALETVYQRTNHMDQGWWRNNREVLWYLEDAPLRSTSVGDIVVSLLSGAAWIVDNIGFKPLLPAS